MTEVPKGRKTRFQNVDATRPIDVLALQIAEIREKTDDRIVMCVMGLGSDPDEMIELEREAEIEEGIATYLLAEREKLGRFRSTPRAWQVLLLRRAGGSGQETVDDLFSSLSPPPAMPPKVRRLLTAIDRGEAYRFKWKTRLPWAEEVIASPSLWQAYDDHLQNEADWERTLRYQRLAIRIADMTAGLRHVSEAALRLLTASDDTLLDEAERLAMQRRALEGKTVRGKEVRSHPRERDAPSIRRTLRRQVSRAAIWSAGILAVIGGRRAEGLSSYADDWTRDRWREKQHLASVFLSRREVYRDDGLCLQLADVVKAAASARESMWYAMTLGMSERARKLGLTPVFITTTLPPRWHPNPAIGKQSYNPELSPTAAARDLALRWRRVRALLRKHDIRVLGVRVVEPHTDACPHSHLLLWVDEKRIDHLKDCFERHFVEPGSAPEAALKIKVWNPNGSGSVAGYVMKYIYKTLRTDSFEDASDEADAGERLAAWASHVGVRRLSLVGLQRGTVGRWRAAYRLVRDEGRPACPRTRVIVHAMRKGRWGVALTLLGIGEGRFATWSEERTDRWGDLVKRTAGWVHARTGEICLVVRPVAWIIRETVYAAVADVVSDPRGLGLPTAPLRPVPT